MRQAEPLDLVWYTPLEELRGEGRWAGLANVTSDLVLVGTRGGLAALEVTSGRRLWRTVVWHWTPEYRAGGGLNIVSSGGAACIAVQEGAGCVDVVSGDLLWSRRLAERGTYGETAIDEFAWYVGTDTGFVFALDPRTGREFWRTDATPGSNFLRRVWGTTASGDTVYVATVRWLTEQGGSTAGDLIALDRRTGRELLRYTTPGPARGGFKGTPIVYGRLLIGNDVYAHALVAVDRFTGQEVWRTAQDERGYITSERPPILVGDTLFAASTDTQVYAINARTGERIWQAFGKYGSLGDVAVCGSFVLAGEFGGGDWIALDRASRVSYPMTGFRERDPKTSRIAVAGNLAVFTSEHGVHAYRC